MKKLFLAFTLLSSLLLVSCATHYQPRSNFFGLVHSSGFGYSEKTLPDGNVQVTFAGNQNTPIATTYKYAMKRAAFVTMSNGYDYFIVVSRNNYMQQEEDFVNGAEEIIYLPTSIVEIRFAKHKTPQTYNAEITSQIQGQ